MSAADMFARHGIADKVRAAAERETAGQVRDADEAIGRAWRVLTEATVNHNGQAFVSHWRDSSGTMHYQVSVGEFLDDEYAGNVIRESANSMAEALDRVLERLNREDWDR
ncbi:hypothetical protein [Gordonia soli]|uniref:Uncharacterized protein n=1 Tax=Gordonia soli NBRC 108243 TaxID=1223545 RepID=M0QRQ9_9ACTN|nr:hypothetical protein [Gordonia soli]GAC71086.1 hypothetical protein GS4_51_00240 [Gordonia soli NBRC 108243]